MVVTVIVGTAMVGKGGLAVRDHFLPSALVAMVVVVEARGGSQRSGCCKEPPPVSCVGKTVYSLCLHT